MRTKYIIPVILAALMLTACGQSQNTEEGSAVQSETVTEETEITTKQPETPEEFHEAMVARSLYSTGNTSRLKAKMEQARSGEKTTIAYIGGSITEGVGGTPETCYAKLSYNYFAETYGSGDNVSYVNAGLSGTPSNLGVLRLERDVLSQKPDIVFVEFAVNDSQDKIAKESYESLVKTVLSQDNEPAVVLLFNVIESGYTAQAHMKEIGEYYDLPMVSAADALTPEFDEGRMTWKDYSNDLSHPNEYGHSLICEFIANMYKAVEGKESEEYKVKPVGKFGSPYENAKMITPVSEEAEGIALEDCGSFEPVMMGTSGFTESWKLGDGSEPMKLKVNGNAFFVIYKRNNSADMGSFEVIVNGDKLATVNTNQSDGWGEAFSQQIIKYQSVHDMDIEIRPCEGSEGKDIEILGFACSQNTTY